MVGWGVFPMIRAWVLACYGVSDMCCKGLGDRKDKYWMYRRKTFVFHLVCQFWYDLANASIFLGFFWWIAILPNVIGYRIAFWVDLHWCEVVKTYALERFKLGTADAKASEKAKEKK